MAVKGLALDALHHVFRRASSWSRQPTRDRAYDAYVARERSGVDAVRDVDDDRRVGTWRATGARGHAEFHRSGRLRACVRFARDHASRVDFHRWAQFELDRQLGEASADARARRHARSGSIQDLAIGSVARRRRRLGVPRLFVRGVSIGAPPDPYAATGQNWGLPPIDPRALRRDRYRYFIDLLRSGFRTCRRAAHRSRARSLPPVLDSRRLLGADGVYVRYPADDLLGIIALESVRHRALVVGEDLGNGSAGSAAGARELGRAVVEGAVLRARPPRRVQDGRRATRRFRSPRRTRTTCRRSPGFWNGRDIDVRRQVGLIASNEDADAAHAERAAERDALLRRLVEDNVIPELRSLKSLPESARRCARVSLSNPSPLVGISLDDLTGEIEPVNVPGVGPDKYSSWTRKMRETLESFTVSDDTLASLRCDGRANHPEQTPNDR